MTISLLVFLFFKLLGLRVESNLKCSSHVYYLYAMPRLLLDYIKEMFTSSVGDTLHFYIL